MIASGRQRDIENVKHKIDVSEKYFRHLEK